ncbi:hypothetical protein HK096_004442, partial [Nowakowskiella sp. JEL0078]
MVTELGKKTGKKRDRQYKFRLPNLLAVLETRDLLVKVNTSIIKTILNQTITGLVDIPRLMNVVEFAEARSFEINALETSLANATEFKGEHRVWQTLPRHMRRRAASHNVKRLPKRVRQRASEQIAKDPGNPQKFKSKKRKGIKKRAKNIGMEFELRQRNKKWLETHLWHAKRMKMIDIWGFRLAHHSSDKSTRAIYRAAHQQCVLSDISYFSTIEIIGKQSEIIKALDHVCDPTYPSISSRRYLPGHRQGITIIYSSDSYPLEPIAPVSFFWKSTNSEFQNEDIVRTLWIWVHPSAIELAKYCISLALSKNCEGSETTMSVLSDELLMFELTGPRSHAILQETLKVSDSCRSLEFWNKLRNLQTSTSLSPGVIISLEIDDPRLTFPSKMKPRLAVSYLDEKIPVLWPETLAVSNIWDSDVRSNLLTSKVSESAINEMRGVAAIDIFAKPVQSLSKIPILLIQHGSRLYGLDKGLTSKDFGGWTMIIPKGWGTALWKSLIFSGARAIGMEERNHMLFESDVSTFPSDWPGTTAYSEWSKAQESSKRDEWEKKPPAKRMGINSNGLGVLGRPFGCNWDAVVHKKTNIYEDLEYIPENKMRNKKIRRGRSKKNTEITDGNLMDVIEMSKKNGDLVTNMEVDISKFESFGILSGQKALNTLIDVSTEIYGKEDNNERTSDMTDFFWKSMKQNLAESSRKLLLSNLKNLNPENFVRLDKLIVKVKLRIIGGGVPKKNARVYEIEESEISK